MTLVTVPTGRTATVADWELINDEDADHRWELFEGVLRMMAPAKPWHDVVLARISGWLQHHITEADRALPNAGLWAKEDSGLMPDVMLLHRPWAGQEKITPADVLLVVEVLSPSTRGTDLVDKFALYAAVGITHYWIVDNARKPNDATVFAYQRMVGESTYTLVSETLLTEILAGTPEGMDLA